MKNPLESSDFRGFLVRVTGIEPAAWWSQTTRAPSCATPGYLFDFFDFAWKWDKLWSNANSAHFCVFIKCRKSAPLKAFRDFLIFTAITARHAPKEIRSTCFRLFPGISAPFRSETDAFRHSCLHCFRVLRSCLWDKLWSSKTPRMQLHAASEVFLLYYSSLALFKFHVARKSGLTTTSPVERSLYSPCRALFVELRSGGKVKSVPSFCLTRMMVSFASVTVP